MMTPYQNFTAEAIVSTDRELQRGIRSISEGYRAVYLKISERVHRFYDDYHASASRDGIFGWGMESGEYEKLTDDVERIYDEGSKELDERVYDLLMVIMSLVYYRMMYAHEWAVEFSGAEIPELVGIPEELLNLAVEGGTSEWNLYEKSGASVVFGSASNWQPKREELSRILSSNRQSQTAKVLSELSSSIMVGTGVRGTLRAVRKVISMKTRKTYADGRKVNVLHGAAASATRVMQTEGNRLINAGMIASGFAFYDYMTTGLKKEWVAVLDTKTRLQSIEMNGQIVGIDEEFVYPNGATSMYPGMSGYPQYDVNDRCSCITYLSSDNGETTGLNPVTHERERFSWSDFPQWLENNGVMRNENGLLFLN